MIVGLQVNTTGLGWCLGHFADIYDSFFVREIVKREQTRYDFGDLHAYLAFRHPIRRCDK